MSRLSTHLPRLATLAVAVAVAAASYCVHADRSASSGTEARDQRAAPPAHAGKHRSTAALDARERRRRSAERKTREQPHAEHRAGTAPSDLASSARPSADPSPPRAPRLRDPHYATRPRTDRDAERGVDRELQRVIDGPAPAPAVPAPVPPPALPTPAPPADPALPAPDVDTTVPVPTTASPAAPAAPSDTGTDHVIPHDS
jgi:hypothetical protein